MPEYIVTFPVSNRDRADKFARVDGFDETDARLKVIERYSREGFGSVYQSKAAAGVDFYGLTEIPFGS